MDSIEVLPNVNIQAKGVVSKKFLEHGIETFCAACHWIKDLAYGSNSNNENSLILFQENRGTCTTKHGVIALLAQELGLEVYKNLGFYRLNDDIVIGVNAIIQIHGLNFIPQIHCFLEYGSFKVDLTEGNCNGKNKTIEDYDFVVRVNPDLTYEEEKRYYISYLNQYFAIDPKLAKVSIPEILELLEACNQQVKYQCSIMSSHNLAFVAQ
ncbi:hypothetical protein VB735_32735 [Halotia wernerae UHCC 0503]|nr:hypothetical protein [Halotia wernerae UHCC 0503]